MVPGFEQAVARMTPDGGLELRVGIQSHGQGLETTLAQVAHEVLGIPLAAIRVVHGDTALTPYSTGTWGSRCMVMAGGAVGTACRELAERIGHIGAHLLQAPPEQVRVGDGVVQRPDRQRADRGGRAHLVSAAAGSAGRRRRRGPRSDRRLQGRCAIPARSAMPRMPRWFQSIPNSATSASSTTRSARMAAR